MMNNKLNNVLLSQQSLKGLAVGDCIGNAVLKKKITSLEDLNITSDCSLTYTDDTEQSLILYKHICKNDTIIPNELLKELVNGFKNSKIQSEYGPKTKKYFNDILNGHLVYPNNSFGNGCIMRIVPTICYLYNDKNIIEKCLNTSLYTHNNIISSNSIIFLIEFIKMLILHREEILKYIKEQNSIIQTILLPEILLKINDDVIKKDINKIVCSELHTSIHNVYKLVGNGQFATCFDTLPVCIWISIRNINDYETAMKECIEIGGDIDTISAIVGSIVALFCDIPEKFINKCEKLYI